MAMFQVSRKILRTPPVGLSRFCTLRAGVDGQSMPVPQTPNASAGAYGSQKQTALDLPPVKTMKNVPQQGWQIDTVVGLSTVPAAGNGRYANEVVKTGLPVIEKRLFPMASIDTLLTLPNDATITFVNVAELEKYIELSEAEGGHDRKTVLDLFEHFIYGFDGVRSCLNVSTWTVNHGDNVADGLNVDVVEKTYPGGGAAYVGEAMTDIKVGEELYMDYRKFKLPEFYLAFTKQNGISDVRTATLEAVYGSSE